MLIYSRRLTNMAVFWRARDILSDVAGLGSCSTTAREAFKVPISRIGCIVRTPRATVIGQSSTVTEDRNFESFPFDSCTMSGAQNVTAEKRQSHRTEPFV